MEMDAETARRMAALLMNPQQSDPYASLGLGPSVQATPVPQATGMALAQGLVNTASHIAHIPERAVMASADRLLGGEMDAGPATEGAMMAVGAASPFAARGAVGAAGGKLAQPEGIRLYHVSPHDFTMPDITKVGTGQGAQSFGHGLYGAESKGVRDDYWDYFANQMGLRAGTPEYLAARTNYLHEGNTPSAITELKSRLESATVPARETNIPRALDVLESGNIPGPRTYEWGVDAKPDQFLDWDRPLGQQSEYVRDTLRNPEKLGLKPAGPLGERGYLGWVDDQNRLIGRAQTGKLPEAPFDDRELGQNLYRGSGSWKPDEGTAILRDAGIPGIRYLDQGSRGLGANNAGSISMFEAALRKHPGDEMLTQQLSDAKAALAAEEAKASHNYVLFDDKIIDILKKYGVSSIAALPPAVQLAIGLQRDNQPAASQQ